jgi:hypothetical protein
MSGSFAGLVYQDKSARNDEPTIGATTVRAGGQPEFQGETSMNVRNNNPWDPWTGRCLIVVAAAATTVNAAACAE